MNERDETKNGAVDVEAEAARDEARAAGGAAEDGTEGTAVHEGDDFDELELLRGELAAMNERLAELERDCEEHKARYLRARADLETYRRRSSGELERARESGLDSALVPVMTVYDDLGRALEMGTADPQALLPGIESMRNSLLRSLENLGVRGVGELGEAFDPDVHEALTAVAPESPEQAGTIAQVFQTGFAKDERLIRPARVVVYQE